MASKSKEITRVEQEGLTEHKSEMRRFTPLMDVIENEDEIMVLADLPGVAKENLTVQLDDAELLIRGAQSESQRTSEWQDVEFYRSICVPNTFNPDGITVELNLGVLRVKLRKDEKAKPKQIKVKLLN